MGPDIDALGGQDAGDRLRQVGVFPRDDLRPCLEDGDAAAEAAEHLGEFQPDIAAADDHQVVGHRVENRAGSCW